MIQVSSDSYTLLKKFYFEVVVLRAQTIHDSLYWRSVKRVIYFNDYDLCFNDRDGDSMSIEVKCLRCDTFRNTIAV
jgi:hypothetical protein